MRNIRETSPHFFSEEALKAFKKVGALDPAAYDHGNDVWGGVKHSEFNDAVDSLLKEYKRLYSNRKPLTEKHAHNFVNFISGASDAKDLSKLSHFDVELQTVARWRRGYYESVLYANGLKEKADEMGVTLSRKQIKYATQMELNGSSKLKLARWNKSRVNTVVGAWNAMDDAAQGMLVARGLKTLGYGAKALGFITIAMSATEGFAGQGTGAQRHNASGLKGAALQACYDYFCGDPIEGAVVGFATRLGDATIRPEGHVKLRGFHPEDHESVMRAYEMKDSEDVVKEVTDDVEKRGWGGTLWDSIRYFNDTLHGKSRQKAKF